MLSSQGIAGYKLSAGSMRRQALNPITLKLKLNMSDSMPETLNPASARVTPWTIRSTLAFEVLGFRLNCKRENPQA